MRDRDKEGNSNMRPTGALTTWAWRGKRKGETAPPGERGSATGSVGLSDRVCSPLLRDTANAQLAEPLQKGGPPHVPHPPHFPFRLILPLAEPNPSPKSEG